MKPKLWMSWSSGKDSAYALWTLQKSGTVDIEGLLTTVNEDRDRVAMHSTRRVLLERQAAALGLPLHAIDLPEACTNDIYEARMRGAIEKSQQDGITQMGFGDLFLEDIRSYRETMLADQPIDPVFPIWGLSTDTLAHTIIDSGFEAYLTCVDPKQVPASYAGRKYDASLLDDLPAGADPCGENGEFHSFVFNAPNFAAPIPCEVGDTVERDGFVFADLKPI